MGNYSMGREVAALSGVPKKNSMEIMMNQSELNQKKRGRAHRPASGKFQKSYGPPLLSPEFPNHPVTIF